jgi:hypothetical protein
MTNLTINHDRRVADLETVYDPVNGVFNSLFATATPLMITKDDGSGQPLLKLPAGGSFVGKDIFTTSSAMTWAPTSTKGTGTELSRLSS